MNFLTFILFLSDCVTHKIQTTPWFIVLVEVETETEISIGLKLVKLKTENVARSWSITGPR